MNTPELIQLLSELALKNYREGIHPDPYAVAAAHTIAAATAAQFSPESADSAAFVSTSGMHNLSLYSAQQAVKTTQFHERMKNYRANTGTYTDTSIIVPTFEALVETLENCSFSRDAMAAYDSVFNARESANYGIAVQAASAIYTHAYACSRSAYTHAIALAAQYPIGEKQDSAFKTAITKRLTSDLLYEPIAPSFFMEIMCSKTLKIIAALLLLAGLLALTLGVCGLAFAPIGIMIAASGLSTASITTAGVIMATSSAGLFSGQFFAAKKLRHANDKSMQAVTTMNNSVQETSHEKGIN